MSRVVPFVLDTLNGRPAEGMLVSLERCSDTSHWYEIATGHTDATGCVEGFVEGDKDLPRGQYRLRYDTAAYYANIDRRCFFHEVVVQFHISDAQRYVLPLILSPYSYCTYRGS